MSVISSDREYVELVHPSVAKLRRTRYIRQNVLGQKLPVTLPLGLEGFEAEVNGLIQGDFSEQFKKRLALQRWHENGDILTYSDIEEAKTCVIEELRKPIEGPRYARVGLRLVEKNSNTLVLRFNPSLGKWNRLCLPADYSAGKLSPYHQLYAKAHGNPWRGTWLGWTHLCRFGVGETRVNSGTSVVFHTMSYTFWGDVSLYHGVVRYNCNWQHDKTNHKFSFEFYLDNDREESNPNLTDGQSDANEICVYDDDETIWSIYKAGTGSYDCSLSEDTSTVKRGASSLKVNITTGGAYAKFQIYRAYATPQDWSTKDFVCIWYYGANSGMSWDVCIKTVDNSWDYGAKLGTVTDNFTGWKRFVFPLRKYTKTGANDPDFTRVTWIIPITDIYPTGALTLYLDRIVVDVGQWVKVEVYVPDVLKNTSDGVKLYWWNPATSAYDLLPATFNPEKNGDPNWDGACIKVLSGYSFDDMYGTGAGEGEARFTFYGKGGRGDAVNHCWANSQDPNGNIVYSNNYGCKKRIGFAIKMPPEDFQDSSTYGISQCRLKLEVYYDKGETGAFGEATFEFENSLNTYYGLQNINKRYIVLFHNSEKRANFIILDNNTVGDGEPSLLELTADENENITKVKIGWAKEKTADLRYGLDLTDPSLDTNGDGIPDLIENVEAYVGGLS